MRKSMFLLLGVIAIPLGSFSLTSCGRQMKSDTYDAKGRLQISIRNLYFEEYSGGDRYLEEVQDKFNVSLSLSSYQWANWKTQTNSAVSADNMTDVFHAYIDSYNFANTYKFWAEDELIKPLPSNLSKWPNIKKVIDNTTNIESLKIDGKLYGIPIAKNTTDYTTSFSPFTYMYRRDWAKKWGVYQENDEYTWSQFETLLEKFRDELSKSNRYALGDEEWGFPSITNFYKQVPHCFAQDEDGKYVCNYTTEEYLKGLNKSKEFMDNGYYYPSQNSAKPSDLNRLYYSNQLGVLYENFSYSNFYIMKQQIKSTNTSTENFDVDDATAIMKIRSETPEGVPEEQGKYCLEGTDNWYSMTFFDFKITDNKMEKVLDILNWLLSEDGTNFAIYGFEDDDYYIDEHGDIKIIEEAWPKNTDGTLNTERKNGAKYLRYLISLGYDTLDIDPLTDKKAVKYLEDWEKEMKDAYDNGELRILKESSDVMWLTSPKRASNCGTMRDNALANVMNYIYGNMDLNEYKSKFNDTTWSMVLNEINSVLG